MGINSKFILGFGILFFFLSLVYYFITPLTFDVYVFLGSAHLAEIQYGGELWGTIQSWELKPFLNRICIYVLYKLTSFFVDFESKREFISVLKIIFSLIIFSAGYCLSILLYKAKLYKSKVSLLFFSAGLLFFHSFRTILQSEYFTLLFSFFSLFLLLSGSKYKIFIGLILLSLIPFFKGISITFIFQILFILYGFYNWEFKKIGNVSVFIFLFCLLTIVTLHTIYPQEFSDIRDAASFQSIMKISFQGLITLIFKDGVKVTLIYISHYPLIPISLLLTLVIFLKKIIYGVLDKKVISLILLWIIGIMAIVIQHKFWAYHFVNLSLPVIFSLVLLVQLPRKIMEMEFFLAAVTFIYFLLITSPLQKLLPDSQVLDKYKWGWDYNSGKEEVDSWNSIILAKPNDLTSSDSVLYLCDGVGVWCWGIKSASRYYYPLPVQRSLVNPTLRNEECYAELLEDMNAFKGKYILLDEKWFHIPDSFKESLNSYKRSEIFSDELHHYVIYARKPE